MTHKHIWLMGVATVLLGCGTSDETPPEVPNEIAAEDAATETQKEPLVARTGPIKIGAILPLSGPATSYGFPVQKAINLRIAQKNNAGGVNGRPVEIIWEDGQCAPDVAAAAAEKLILVDGVHSIIGGLCSSETIAASPIAEANQKVLLTPISKSPKIAGIGDYTFRLNVNSTTFGTVGGPGFSGLFPRVSSIVQQTDFAVGTELGFQNEYTGEFASNQFNTDEVAFRPIAEAVKGQEPDAVLVAVQTLDKFESIYATLTAMEYTPTLIVNELIAGSPAMVAVLSDYAGEVYSVLHVPPSNKAQKEFEVAYEAEYKEEPSYADATTFAVDAVDVLLAGYAAQDGANGLSLQKFLSGVEHDGFAGQYSFDANNEATVKPLMVQLDKDRKEFIRAKKSAPPAAPSE